MPACVKPTRLAHRDASGTRYSGTGPLVPCGKCIACRLNHGRDWALRIVHETKMHDANSFLTLTYSDQCLPRDGGLSKREFQLFMKRLRTHFRPGLRFFGCGEYGEETRRPHYHLILFGEDFSADRKLWKRSPSGELLYVSDTLNRLWRLGHALIGDVTYGSAVYVARYNMKNKRGSTERFNPETGDVYHVEQDFLVMSRNPGLGASWWDKYKSDAFPSDFLVLDGKRMPVPRYYRLKYNDEGEAPASTLKRSSPLDGKRKALAMKHPEEATAARRLVRDEVLHRAAPQAREVPEDDI